MTGPRYTPLIQSLPSTVPFVGPEEHERQRGRPFRARLGANESVFGPSPQAIEAMAREAAEVWKYGDSTNHDLRHALADHLGIGPDHIIVGEGIDGLLGYLVRLLVGPGDAVVTSDGAYPTFNFHVAGFGGVLHKVPYAGDHEDPAGLAEAAHRTNAKVVYLSNPDNPMGTSHPAPVIRDLLDALPEETLLVLDEAYVEFAPEEDVLPMAADDPRLIRFRTFSKGYGMAGARVGYGIGTAELIRSFDKIRNHFGMSRISQAGALAALRDRAWLSHVIAEVARAKKRIGQIAVANGLTPLASATNFVAVDCGADGDFARKVLKALEAEDVFVRMPFVAPQDRCIRISAGKPRDLDLLAEALPRALEAARR